MSDIVELEAPPDTAVEDAGAAALVAMKAVEKLLAAHEKALAGIHMAIVEFGRTLQVGRDLHDFDNDGFARWVAENQLDTGRVFGVRHERTAAMTIAELVLNGFAMDEENGGLPQFLDLSECYRARPTDIVEWARRKQPHLFEDLVLKKAQAKQKRQEKNDEDPLPEDDVSDLGSNTQTDSDDAEQPTWVNDLAAEVKNLRARIVELENDVLTDEEKTGWMELRELVNAFINEAVDPLPKATQKTIQKAMAATETKAVAWADVVVLRVKPRGRKPKKTAE
jgi:hypothetical protein